MTDRRVPTSGSAGPPGVRRRDAGGRPRRLGDAGNMAIELALGMPVFLALITFVVILGRQTITQGAIDVAAHDAARAASLSRTAVAAQVAARDAAVATLRDNHVTCQRLSVAVDVRGFSVPVGRPANVTVRVSCRVSFVDVALPGTPQARILSATFTSPLDQYRGRT